MDKKTVSNLAVYGLAHAVIDATCAAVIFSLLNLNAISSKYFFYLVILYNVLAFGLQAIIGLYIDNWRAPKFSAIFGSVLTACSVILISISPLAAVLLAGIGNAFFHVGGGSISLNLTPKKASAPGVYVAPGALGLFVGALIGKTGNFAGWHFLLAILFLCVLMFITELPKMNYNKKSARLNYFELILILVLLAITVRSFIGLAIVFPWKSNLLLGIILVCAVVLGKGLGGIFADRFGWIKIAVGALLVSCPLLAFGSSYPIAGIAGMFLFNMTMPVTLVAISNILPGRPGFSFGLTCLALLVGCLPIFTQIKNYLNGAPAVIGIIIFSAVSLYISLKMYLGKEKIFKSKKAD